MLEEWEFALSDGWKNTLYYGDNLDVMRRHGYKAGLFRDPARSARDKSLTGKLWRTVRRTA
jgi:hypothetical protein